MAEEGKGGMTRRDFLGIATAGLGATAGGVVASLVTRQIDKTVESEGVGATGGTTGVEGNGKATDPLADLPSDNVGASDAVPSSVADTEATDVEVEAPSETIRYDIVDSHLHYVDFIQRSDGFAALTDAMDLAGVSRAVIFGLGIAKQWDEDVDRAPKYYLSNDSRCYYYSGTDFIVAEELLAQPAEVRDRFLPFCCGINGNDRFAAEHIRQLLRLYPKFWRGIGEVMSRPTTSRRSPTENHPISTNQRSRVSSIWVPRRACPFSSITTSRHRALMRCSIGMSSSEPLPTTRNARSSGRTWASVVASRSRICQRSLTSS